MAKSNPAITKRQRYWLNHIKAADASDGSLVEYAATHKLKVKDLYQWKTVLARRGFLPGKTSEPTFVAVTPAVPTAQRWSRKSEQPRKWILCIYRA